MVVLLVKRGDEHVFNMECSAADRIPQITERIVKLYGARLRLKRLIEAANCILAHGPLHPPHLRLIDDDDDDEDDDDSAQPSAADKGKQQVDPLVGQVVTVNGRQFVRNPDPTGQRTGECPVPEVAETVKKTLEDANVLLDKEHSKSGKFLLEDEIEEHVRLIGGALTIAYPMGFPDDEPARLVLEKREKPEDVKEAIQLAEAALWWANRELQQSKVLSDYVGRNEKTKIIVKLQRKNQGPPVREPPLDEMGQRHLMAYYYKKQEQNKRLEENKDDEYLDSSWANPKALKQAFNGLGNVSWRPH
ncbi:hypothetical protein HDU96_003345 [Phlyctochytrium bullatum]|nr:hypothetical protein HDU96_003345 [Phlyctochytrium bullatum]